MAKGNEYRIVTIADIANLSPDQRKKCLVDFWQWLAFRDAMQSFVDEGVMDPITEMVWVDDDRIGEVSGITIIDRQTGETVIKQDL